ncbi:cation-translocating P-type ATPase [Saccharothrix sp. NPDC042600]|uniref:cation-translocating P-type ATPase n=1 Tax=Saccharothrix TaxID=2071 RepID=UPI0033C7564E|nr:cation-translocating P-type ATPase [Saccharothrix mutabilis subsp. capreolus]
MSIRPSAALKGLFEVGLTATGFAWAATASVLRVPRLLTSAADVVSFVDATPRLRAAVGERLGAANAELLFTVGGTAAQVLAQRPLGLLADTCRALSRTAETRAQHRSTSGRHRAADAPGRPVPVPPGPVERTADRVAALAVPLVGGTLLTSGDRTRASAALAACAPKPARAGRDVFVTELSRMLAGRRVAVRDLDALTRLDRVDVVVVDTAVAYTGRLVVDEVRPVTGNGHAPDVAELRRHAHELVDAGDPDGDWTLAPHPTDPVLLALRRRAVTVAEVTLAEELHPLADAVVASARKVGLVVLSAADRRLAGDAVADGPTLVAAVRSLQRAGRVVAVVSRDDRDALAVADVGIGLGPLPTADVVCHKHATVCVVLEAAVCARHAAVRSARLAVVGAACAALLAVVSPAGRALGRVAWPVNAATVLAIAAGAWAARDAAHRPDPVPVDRTAWHALSVATVLHRLGSSPDGVDDAEAARRRAGRGTRRVAARETLLRASLAELDTPLTPALAISAAVSATVGSVVDAGLIISVLAANAVLGGAQRMRAAGALKALVQSTAVRARVLRDGAAADLPADRLVRGDVVELQAGDVVPADCRLLAAEGLELDESGLTGESVPVRKDAAPTPEAGVADRTCMSYQGTSVAAGRARGVVVAVGGDTELGRAGGDAQRRARPSGVTDRMRALARTTIPLSIGAGVLLAGVDLLRGRPLGRSVVRGVGLAVAAVPEGLPFVATVAELAAAKRLSRRGALVRDSATVEALGRVDVLCFDKTGTLTEGRIALRRVSDGRTDAPVEELPDRMRPVVTTALRATPRGGGRERLAHLTDRAVHDGAELLGVRRDWDVATTLPFEPSRGFHAVLGRAPEGCSLAVKGAPEVILARCATWRRGGTVVPLDEAARAEVDAEVRRLASHGYRLLAVAERTTSARAALHDDHVDRLCLVGLLALADPLRGSARQAVRTLRDAGIQVVMVTGDHHATAAAIADELDALGGRGVLTGPELAALTDLELDARLPGTAVFARVTPAQKARIVAAFQRRGHVVAVTGDGANDAPAIRLADVGMALGEHATTAAREAADVVITDDRVETIADAVAEGRAMWASVRDGLAILLGGNLGEIAFAVATGVAGARETLNVRQLLLVNLLTDALPAMAVATRPPADRTAASLLAEGPDPSLGEALDRQIRARAVATAAAGLVAWQLARRTGPPFQASTTALVALVGAQLGQTLAVRGRTPLVVAAALGSLAALAVAVQTPGLSEFLGCHPLLPHQWLIALGAAAVATLAAAR